MWEEFEENAEQELKRADHIVFVSLKYTRTADVIKNAIGRFIAAFDFAVLEALEFLKVKNIPDHPRARASLFGEKLKNFHKDITFYNHLRDINKAPFQAKEEYRKNVTLITTVQEVNIEVLKEYFEHTKKFVKEVEEFVRGQKK